MNQEEVMSFCTELMSDCKPEDLKELMSTFSSNKEAMKIAFEYMRKLVIDCPDVLKSKPSDEVKAKFSIMIKEILTMPKGETTLTQKDFIDIGIEAYNMLSSKRTDNASNRLDNIDNSIFELLKEKGVTFNKELNCGFIQESFVETYKESFRNIDSTFYKVGAESIESTSFVIDGASITIKESSRSAKIPLFKNSGTAITTLPFFFHVTWELGKVSTSFDFVTPSNSPELIAKIIKHKTDKLREYAAAF